MYAPACQTLALLLLSGVATLAAEELPSANPRPPQPNVLFLVIDDQNDWVSPLAGHPRAHTPHLHRLAQRGTTFVNAHCQAPLCNPSRTSVMLGLRPTTTGIYGLTPSFRDLPHWQDRVTLPQYFRQQGYQVLTAGKIYHHAGLEQQRRREWDHWGPRSIQDAQPNAKLIPDTPMGNHPLIDWGVFPHRDDQKRDYQTASWGIEQLQRLDHRQPFWMALGFSLPHVPCYVTQAWYDLYPSDDSVLPRCQSNDRDDIPRFAWYLHWHLPEPRLRWLQQTNQWQNLARSYLASTSFVDAQIGRLLDGLQQTQRDRDTIVVVWSDHGWHLGEKGITGKNSLWEESTRVPLIFAGPGIGAGQRCQRPVELLDLYPTLVELCGLPPRSDLEGLSLVPQLRDAQADRVRPAVTCHNPGNYSVRSESWRYIRYADGSEELYDEVNDPHEWHNVVSDPAHGPLVTELRKSIPQHAAPHAAGSAQRILEYDAVSDTAVWEGKTVIRRDSPIPE